LCRTGKVRHVVIWLLRHAHAGDGSPDAERQLSERGEAQARDAGEALAALGVHLDACVSSPKLRAADTARLVCEQLGGPSTLASSPRIKGRRSCW
jgi:phosphohistidine phosphatase